MSSTGRPAVDQAKHKGAVIFVSIATSYSLARLRKNMESGSGYVFRCKVWRLFMVAQYHSCMMTSVY